MTSKTLLLAGAALATVFAAMAFSLGYYVGLNRRAAPVAATPVSAAPAGIASAPASPPLVTEPTPTTPPPIEPAPVAAAKLQPQSEPPSPYKKVKVLVIGTNRGGPEQTPLDYAESDAAEIARLFGRDYRFEVATLIGSEATGRQIRATLRATLDGLQPDEDFIFFFSGHGTTFQIEKPLLLTTSTQSFSVKRHGLLLAYDAAPETASRAKRIEGGLLTSELATMLAASTVPGRHRLALIDACFSGFVVDPGAATVQTAAPAFDLNSEKPLELATVQIITSSQAGERAIELKDLEGGTFTTALREILTTDRYRGTLSIFFELRDLLGQEKYLHPNGGRGSTPGYFALVSTGGDFWFIPPPGYRAWHESRARAAGIGAPTGGFGVPVATTGSSSPANRGVPVTAEEANAALKVIGESSTTGQTLTPAQIARFEDRSAVNDPKALVVMTALLGRNTDALSRQRAFDYAYAAYETGDAHGKAALASAFAHGYGVEKDATLGDALMKQSGLGEAVGSFILGVAAYRTMENSTDDRTRLAAGATAAASFWRGTVSLLDNPALDRWSNDPVRKTRFHLTGARNDLVARRLDLRGARKHLNDLRRIITAAEEMPQNHKDFILERIAQLEQTLAGDEPNKDEAVKIIDDLLPRPPSPTSRNL